ncbi:hypothetical protein E2562_028586 [Oryza meyeriana var. granulata]|uniref:Uncharacterized protein n=1 Tax=Oryza meyeriana var. granulata TaxID=110450 RepID=A0A6G1D8P8_9ORYZ|nr:hypothetical protein E2562_028586 [Oryza meyeriana var. granulata]
MAVGSGKIDNKLSKSGGNVATVGKGDKGGGSMSGSGTKEGAVQVQVGKLKVAVLQSKGTKMAEESEETDKDVAGMECDPSLFEVQQMGEDIMKTQGKGKGQREELEGEIIEVATEILNVAMGKVLDEVFEKVIGEDE